MQIIDSFFETVGKYGKRVLEYGVSSEKASLSEQLRNTQITPVCFVEKTLTVEPVIKDILTTQLDMFSLMYLSVFNKMTSNMITNCSTEAMLDSLATDRDLDTQLVAVVQNEDNNLLNYTLNDLAVGKHYDDSISTPTLQAKYYRAERADSVVKIDSKSMSGEILNDLKDAPRLGVGRHLRLKIDLGKAGSSNIDVMVRLATNIVSTRLITAMVEANVANVDFLTRVKMRGYGEITTWELLSLSDIIDRQQRVAVMDIDDVFGEKFRRGSSDVAFFFARGELPINRASGIMVISQETATALESTLGDSLSDFGTRERFFKGTCGMILTVVDTASEVVTTYYRGLRHPQDLTFRDIKKSKDKDDLTDVLKILTENNTPKTFY